MSDDLEFAVKCHEGQHTVRVSPSDDGVWINLFMPGCNAYATLTKDEARQVIAALTAVVEAK